MSLYNMLHGFNPFSSFFLSCLGITDNDVPRFRDCFLTEEGNIAIHTRTGGGNRDFYESLRSCQKYYPEYFEDGKDEPKGPWNENLRDLPGFIEDKDDEFDSTYATFYYKPDEEIAPLLNTLKEIIGTETPAEKWKLLFEDMEAHRNSSRVRNAIEVGRPIFEAINKNFKDED